MDSNTNMNETVGLQDNPTTETQPPVARHPSLQSRAIGERITAAELVIMNAQADPALLEIMSPFGYDADAFAAGLAVQQAARQAYNARQQVLAARYQVSAGLREESRRLRRDFSDYRGIGRSLFSERLTRASLGLTGAVPYDQMQFIQFARSMYHTAASTPEFIEIFSEHGYTVEKFAGLVSALDGYTEEWGAYTAAAADALNATETRDDAIAALDAWMVQLRAAGRVAARSHPELAMKLGL